MTERLYEEGRAAWPAFELSAEAFDAHLRRVQPGDVGSGLSGADLFLTAAVLANVPAAVTAFDALLSRAVARCAHRIEGTGPFAPDAVQSLRVRFLSVAPGQRSALLGYRGSGPLAGWLRTTAARELLRLKTRVHPAEALDTGALELAVDDSDPELSLLRQNLRPHFKAALREALEQLPARDRMLLSLVYLDGVSFLELSRMYRQHRVTLARHVAAARSALMLATRQKLSLLSGVPEPELVSILAVIQTGLSGNIKSLLEP